MTSISISDLVIAYLEAEANLRTLCQETAADLSQMIEFNFVAACSTGCC